MYTLKDCLRQVAIINKLLIQAQGATERLQSAQAATSELQSQLDRVQSAVQGQQQLADSLQAACTQADKGQLLLHNQSSMCSADHSVLAVSTQFLTVIEIRGLHPVSRTPATCQISLAPWLIRWLVT